MLLKVTDINSAALLLKETEPIGDENKGSNTKNYFYIYTYILCIMFTEAKSELITSFLSQFPHIYLFIYLLVLF